MCLRGWVPLDEVGGGIPGGEAAREHAERLPRAEVGLDARLQRWQLPRVRVGRARAGLVRAELETLDAVGDCAGLHCVPPSVFIVILLLPLTEPPAVELREVRGRHVAVLPALAGRLRSVVWQWTWFVELELHFVLF